MSAGRPLREKHVQVGEAELVSLPDALGLLGELEDLYPEVPEAAWDPYRTAYPELFAGKAWALPVMCFLCRTSEHTIVVDAGAGPGVWDWEVLWEGGLPAALKLCDAAPESVDCVVLTHLHVDHVGWLADGLFPRARHIVHREAFEFARAHSPFDWLRAALGDLHARELLDVVDGGAAVVDGVTVTPLPGHYPGHLGVQIDSDGSRALVIADAAVHPALLDEPDWRYVSDHDYETAAATRRTLVEELAGSGVIVACGHYPAGAIGRLSRVLDRVVWEPVS